MCVHKGRDIYMAKPAAFVVRTVSCATSAHVTKSDFGRKPDGASVYLFLRPSGRPRITPRLLQRSERELWANEMAWWTWRSSGSDT